jgi:putative heme-binding domain-containing protein
VAQETTPNLVRNPLATDAAAIGSGQELYNQTCQVCHGPAGQGDRGPALNVPLLAHGSEDADIFRAIRTGIAGTQMPPFPALSDNQVWQLVSYIHSLQGIAPSRAAPDEGNAAAGETLLFGTAACANCHEVNGRGGVVGPDLSNAGRYPAAVLRQKIVNPDAPLLQAAGGRGASPPVTIVARTQDGRELRGVRRNEDTFSIQMVDAAGQLHLLEKPKLASFRVENKSLMPGDYGARLSQADLTNLIAFLRAQQGRDFGKTISAQIPGGVSYDRLRNSKAEPHNWLMYWGDYAGTHYSGLKQIDTSNAGMLRAEWTFPLAGDSVMEATPLVVILPIRFLACLRGSCRCWYAPQCRASSAVVFDAHE